MQLEFSGKIWYWRGPAPFYFVTVPPKECEDIKAIASSASYGWGCMYARVEIGGTRWRTALMPKDGSYVVPVKERVRQAEQINEGDIVAVRLEIE
jgi:hypothetical protein